MARTRARRPRGSGSNGRSNDGILPVLARVVREVEADVRRGRVGQATRAKFQAVAMLTREERTKVKADPDVTEAFRTEQLRRLDGIATILATSAATEPNLFTLLGDDAVITPETRAIRAELEEAAGFAAAEPEPEPEGEATPAKRVVPPAVVSRQLANPFMAPTFTDSVPMPQQRRLDGWELIGPLLSSFERAAPGAPACMALPEPTSLFLRDGRQLMKHQAQVIEAAREGHRTFLLADEPGLGKTAQALLAAEATDAFPLLAVVPNVVKINWAREAAIWTPRRRATVIHGDGNDIDAFADIVVINYEVLDRHVGWLGEIGFRGVVLDEAHFIKNKTSQRSQNVLKLSAKVRSRVSQPLLMALTGTPLINDIDDFRAIWEFLGWIDDKKPLRELMARMENNEKTPLDPGFFPSARKSVIDMGIVRRRKQDVAADIPARRIADLPVELSDEDGRSIRAAEAELARRLVRRYDAAVEARTTGEALPGIDLELVRRVARMEREDAKDASAGDNVFGMMRKIGLAKAGLAADYTAQLARSVGKVVFFAKHIDVMDTAEQIFKDRDIPFISIRGDQSRTARQNAVDAFVNDPEIMVAVCSLTAAGVGLNLQVASNVVLAELSWTDAEQQQAIDRVHRIGQDAPVTAWRIIAAQTLDPRIVELVDSKANLAARALDGADVDDEGAVDVQLEALVGLLSDELQARLDAGSAE
ncbi:MAG TPA: DEAD/DEAH box helicase [Aeromicrobium sp.]|nr:DEAD/DEAH box helicase [Aeromicrobium sp.]